MNITKNNNIFVYDKLDEKNISPYIDILNNVISENPSFQFYLLNKPIIEDKYEYDYEDNILIILSPKHKILFINLWDDVSLFEEYIADFLEDFWSISNEFNHLEIIWRPRTRKEDLIIKIDKSQLGNLNQILEQNILSVLEKRKVELIISLLIWSINNVNKIWTCIPETVLEKVKKNITLFDAEQTRFIYNSKEGKVIKIQWLAWTWKTELLLHKLKDIYVKSDETKIFFTCHNKILANDLNSRIPAFFDFMRVKKQIDRNNRLRVWNAWWLRLDPNSWLYSYLCDFYEIPFMRFNRKITGYKEIFWDIKKHIKKIKDSWNFKYALDYILIDESQDFPEELFELCKEIVKDKIYIAGDIFQNIFDVNIEEKVIDVDFVLNKCYRTEPKTLMFAHALWMWLFENKKFNWLKDDARRACWYIVWDEKELTLSREPIKRFEDINIDSSINLNICSNFSIEVLRILSDLKTRYNDVEPEDIAIVLIDDSNEAYSLIDELAHHITTKIGYKVNKWHVTKSKQEKGIFISNANNVKGLEFPFIICITDSLRKSYIQRNKLYTVLTRSFLESYLLVEEENEYFAKNLDWLSVIKNTWYIKIDRIDQQEQDKIKNTIIKVVKHTDLNELLENSFLRYNISSDSSREILKKFATEAFKENDFDEFIVDDFIQNNLNYF